MKNNSITQFKYGLFSLLFIILIGIIGYEIIEEDWDFIDSFYMTIITISTTGFKEVKDLSSEGRLFTIFLIISGVLSIAYTGGKAAQILIEKQIFRRRRMERGLETISNHFIVCGYGRMGKQICEALKENGYTFVVIENNPPNLELLVEKGFYFIDGDSSSDEALIKAGVKRAKGLVSVVATDAENVFTTLSAKELNPKIFVVARAIDEGTESKLLKAGADRVVKPYELGGNRLVQLLMRPGVMDFIDGVARNNDIAINLEEITVGADSSLIGKSLAESPIRKDLNIIIVAIYRQDGTFIYNPKSMVEINVNDKLIAIGETESLNKLTILCVPANKPVVN
ncbi:MAG: potassium channel protein [Melioribacteraceae bacterium]|nr:potassium channel protein [Melioribacteraceae bacterium]